MKRTSLGRLAAYYRVSSEEQKQGQSVEGQRTYVRGWVRRHELCLAHEFTDEADTGQDEFNDRLGGRDLYRAAQRGEFDTLIVFAVDRLGRSTYAVVHFFHFLRKLGIRIISTTEDFDPDESTGKFLIAILAGKSESDKTTIRLRTESGKANWQSVADTYTGGSVPFGYCVERRGKRQYYAVCHARIPTGDCSPKDVIRYLFHRCLEGADGGLIAAELNARGITTCWVPGDSRYALPSRAKWDAQRVEQILRNPFYKGVQVIGDPRKRSKVVRSEPIFHAVPAIVTEEAWLRAQECRKANRTRPERGEEQFYLLRGKIRCPCGHRYCGGTSVGAFMPRGRYYRCDEGKCGSKWLLADDIEAQVREDILWILSHADQFVAEIQRRLGSETERIDQLLDEAASLDRARADLDKVESEYLRLRAAGLIATDAKLHDLLSEVRTKEATLGREALALREKAQQVAQTDGQLRAAAAVLEVFHARLAQGFSPEEWRQLVALLVDRIEVETVSVLPPPPRRRGDRARKQALPHIYYRVDLVAVGHQPTSGLVAGRELNNEVLACLKKGLLLPV